MLLAVLLAALAVVMVAAMVSDRPISSSPEMLLDAVWDRIGVTRWSEAMEWLALETEGSLADTTGDTPVWVGRNGRTYFHSNPLCSAVKSPVHTTLEMAQGLGFIPCPQCWEETQ